jgi:hypothetical protein
VVSSIQSTLGLALLDWFDTNPRLEVIILKFHGEDVDSLLGCLGKAVGSGAGRAFKPYVGAGVSSQASF